MNPHETFAADRSLLHSPSEIDFLSELFAFGGFEGLLLPGEKPFRSRNFVHDERSQEQVKSGN